MIPLKKGSTPQTTNSVSPIRTVFNVRTWPLQWMAVATVLTSIALAYGNSVKAPFLFDDSVAIVDNQTIRHLVSLAVLVPPTDGSTTTGRPVVNLSFALNYAISGEQTWSYHVLNITIHALAALTLMGIVLRTLSSALLRDHFGAASGSLALVIALLWALHPLQTESVVCIAQRTESLCSLFYMLTLYTLIRGAEGGVLAQGWYTLSIMCCLAGMGSKEVMVTAPLVALLYDRTFLAGSFSGVLRERRTYYLCLTSTWLLLGWLVSHGGGTRGEAAGFGLGMAWWPYTLKQCEAIPHYLKLALWPHPLILDYGDAVVRSLAQVWWRGTGLVALVASAIWALRLKPALGFAGACFFFILAPSSSVVPLITQTMAEHRMYLALAAVIILPVLTAYHHLGHKAVIGCAAVALVFAGLTFIRSSTYHTAVSVWADTVNKQPDNARAHNNLAVELRKDPARVPEALAHYEKALQIRPDYAEAHFNLANELVEIPHRMPEALTHYEQALRIKPNYAAAHNNLARELVKIPGRQPEALAHYEQALRFKPDLASAHNNFASELAGIPGRLPEALAHYEQALRLKPDYAAAHFNLANVLATIPGRAPEAIAHYEQALRIKPDFAAAHLNLANELAQIPGRTTEALTHYEQALQFEPSNPFAHNNLAYTLAGIPDRWQEARAHYQEALRIKPDFVLAHRNLAALLANNGELNEAVKHMEMVLQFDPSDESARSYLSILQGRSKP